MDSTPEKVDRHATTPFLLKLFFRNGAFHTPDEFASQHLPDPHIDIYTWPSCTLSELSHHLAAAEPPVLPEVAIGTRLAFRLVFRDARSGSNFAVQDMGSVVLGDGGPGIVTDADDAPKEGETVEAESSKTLAEARFMVGDYVTCAILPPADDGTVTPASAASAARNRGGAPRGGAGQRGGRGGGFGGGFGGRGGQGMGEWRRGERLPEAPMGRGRGRRR